MQELSGSHSILWVCIFSLAEMELEAKAENLFKAGI